MAKGFEIGVGVDTKAAKQAIDAGLVEPLEGAQEELKRLGDSRGPEELERSLEDAQDATQKLERETRQTADAIEEEYRRAYREQERSADDAGQAAGAATAEFKREALANFSEVTSSFDGSMESIKDLVQGTFGGLAAGIAGPVGLAAGGAAAAVGLIGQAIEGVGETAEANEQAAANWAQAYIDAGSRIISSSQIVAESQAIATDPEQYKKAQENAKNWGVDVATAIRAMAGDATALGIVKNNVAALADEMQRYADTRTQPTEAEIQRYLDISYAFRDGSESLKALTDGMADGQERAQAVSDALLGVVASAQSAVEEVDTLGNKLITLDDGTQILITADTKQATLNIDRFQGDLDGIPETVSTDLIVNKPDVGGIFTQLQQQLNQGTLRLNLGVYTRNGVRVD